MRQAVLIGSWSGGREPLDALLESLRGCQYPIWIVINDAGHADPAWLEELGNHYNLLTNQDDGYELGAIRTFLDETDVDEFVFLQDSFVVLDQSFLDLCFAHRGSVALGNAGFHYAWKFRRAILDGMTIPRTTTKAQSVHYEGMFARDYWERDPDTLLLDPDFHDGLNVGFEERFGRTNMVLRNQWFEKRKADWGQRPL